MQELLLFGQIRSPDSLLSVLTGLTGHQPQRELQRHAIYRPNAATAATVPGVSHVGGTQTITQDKKKARPQNAQAPDILYSQTVQTLRKADFESSSDEGHAPERSIVNNDLPLPGQRSVTQRTTYRIKVLDGNVHQRMLSEKYRLTGPSFVSEYITDGYRFTYNNIAVHVYHIKTFHQTEHVVTAPRSDLPSLDSLVALDSSGAYMVEASVLLEDDPTPKIVKLGTDELLGFQRDMQGVVKLVNPERLSLDTRVRTSAR